MPTLGQRIRSAREKKGLSQGGLAKAAKVNRSYLSEIENGANFTVDVLARLAAVLGIDEIPIAGRKQTKDGALRLVREDESPEIDVRFLSESASRIASEAQRLLRHVRGGSAMAPKLDVEEQAPSEPDVARTVRIYLVEDDVENEEWRNRMIDFASRSDELAWREGRHTPAKYHSPLQGNAAAGHGAELLPVDDEDLRQIPDHYWEKHGARFALRIVGDSMIRRRLFDGELVFVRPLLGEEPRRGSVVIAELDDKLVCKVFERMNGKPILRSAGRRPTKPIDPSKFGHFAVRGAVVGHSGEMTESDED